MYALLIQGTTSYYKIRFVARDRRNRERYKELDKTKKRMSNYYYYYAWLLAVLVRLNRGFPLHG